MPHTNDAAEEDEMKDFHEQLQAVKDKIPKHNLGYFNAKVGRDNIAFERTVGRNGMGDKDENGQLVEFCSNDYYRGPA